MTALDVTFNGTALLTAVPSVRVLADGLRRPGMSDNRDEHVKVSGGAGDWLFADNPGDGTIEIPIALAAGSYSAVRAATRLVAAWAKSTVRKKLIFSDESSVYWYAKLADDWYTEEGPSTGFLTLKFDCLPYAYSTSVSTEGPYAATSGVAHTFSISDTIDAFPNIQVQAGGSGITGGFTLTVNGDSLVVGQNVAASGYRTVMSTAYTVVNVADPDTELVGSYSAATVSMSSVTGDFGNLVSGNNSITVTTADASATTVTVRWRRRYD